MKPAYFPFTYLSEALAEALASCFRRTGVYQPSSRNIPETMEKRAGSTLDVRVPVSGDEDELEALMREYRHWAELHGGEMGFFKTRKDSLPFFDEDSMFEIRSSIRKKNTGQAGEREKNDPLTDARLFLRMAQEFDMQTRELRGDLASFEKMEQELLTELKGEMPESDFAYRKGETPPEDLGHHMTAARVNAWARLMAQDAWDTGLFVTDSRAVWDYLLDKSPQAAKIAHFGLPLLPEGADGKRTRWRERLAGRLETLCREEWRTSGDMDIVPPDPSGGKGDFSLTFFIVPGESPPEFFRRCVSPELFRNKGETYGNTLLGLVEL